jgi:phage FluMu gp28-like protein
MAKILINDKVISEYQNNILLKNPIIVAKRMGYDLEEYQKAVMIDLMNDDYNFLCVNKSRQVGLSFTFQLFSVIITNIFPKVKVIFVSYRVKDSIEKLEELKNMYELIPSDIKKRVVKSNSTLLRFANGSEIESCSTNSVRGGQNKRLMYIFIDEFAFFTRSAENKIWKAIWGGFSTVYKHSAMAFISTPLGKDNKFYEVFTMKNSEYKKYLIYWWNKPEFVKKGLFEKAQEECPTLRTEDRVFTYASDVLLKIYKNTDKKTFRQEFECQFIDFDDILLDRDIIERNLIEEEFDTLSELEVKLKMVYKNVDKVLTIDPASGDAKDKTAVSVFVKVNGIYKQVFCQLIDERLTEQENIIKNLADKWCIDRIVIDSRGIGYQMADDLVGFYGNEVVYKYQATEEKNTRNGLLLQTLLLENRMKVIDRLDVIKALRQLKKSTKESKTVIKLSKQRDEWGHSDSASSILLFCAYLIYKEEEFVSLIPSQQDKKED